MSAHPGWLGWLCSMMLRATWQASVLIVLVVVAQRLLRSVLPPQWRHALWILVLIRLALPFSFQSPISLFNIASTAPVNYASPAPPPLLPAFEPTRTIPFFPAPAEPTLVPSSTVATQAGSEASRTGHQTGHFNNLRQNMVSALPFFWLLGVVLLLARMLWANARLSSALRDKKPLSDLAVLRLARECGRIVGLRQNPWIIETAAVRSPALFGFSVPRLLLPSGMLARFSLQELRYILLHEFCHLRRRDILLNWLTALLQILHWFNPLVWFACSRMRSDRELACDAQVLSRLEPAENREYGNTVIRLLESFARPVSSPGLVGILEDPGQMKRRIRMISRFGKVSCRWRWIGAACALILSAAVLTDARTSRPQLPSSGASEAVQRVVVRVLSLETGAPVAGARLNGEQATDSQGLCELRTALPADVRIRASGYVPRQIRLDDTDGPVPDVHLERAVTIGGTVRNEDGKPVAGVEVHLLSSLMSVVNVMGVRTTTSDDAVATTDAEGRWVCSEAPRDMGILIELVHRDYAPSIYSPSGTSLVFRGGDKSRIVSSASLTDSRADLVIERGIEIAGVVVDTRGKPVEGATVDIGSAYFLEETHAEKKTGPDGRFVFHSGARTTVGLTVRATGYAMQRKSLDLTPGMPEIRVILPAGERLRIHVVDDAGLPVPGARVTASQTGLDGKTDNKGDLVWYSSPAEPFMVHVHAEGRKDADEAVEPGGRENTIHLRDLSQIKVTGTVVDSKTRQPIPEFRILTSTSKVVDSWQDYRRAAVGKDGRFSLTLRDSFPSTGTIVQKDSSGDKLIRYSVGLRIDAHGYFPDTSHTVAIENGDATVEVALESAEGFGGTVRLPGGETVSGARVFLTGKRSLQMTESGVVVKRPWDDNMEALTDKTGSFKFDPKKDARAVIAVHEKGIAMVRVEKPENPVSVVLEPWGRLEGSFRIGSRAGSNEVLTLGSNEIKFRQAGLMVYLRAGTDLEGRFVFTRVPAGQYVIGHTLKDDENGTVTVSVVQAGVEAGKTNAITIGGMGRPVVGRIALTGSGAQVPRDQLRAILENDNKKPDECCSIRVQLTPEGSFRVEDVLPGTYLLRVVNPMSRLTYPDIKVVIPEIPGGRSDKPLDLGTLTIR